MGTSISLTLANLVVVALELEGLTYLDRPVNFKNVSALVNASIALFSTGVLTSVGNSIDAVELVSDLLVVGSFVSVGAAFGLSGSAGAEIMAQVELLRAVVALLRAAVVAILDADTIAWFLLKFGDSFVFNYLLDGKLILCGVSQASGLGKSDKECNGQRVHS